MVPRTRKLFIALVGAALTLASGGCGSDDPTSGSITVTLTTSGAGVGKTGNVIVEIWPSGGVGAPTFRDNSLVAVTLASGTPLQVPRFEGVPPGAWTILAWLDVNGSLDFDGGDVVWGTGPFSPYLLDQQVVAGEDTHVVLDLNSVF